MADKFFYGKYSKDKVWSVYDLNKKNYKNILKDSQNQNGLSPGYLIVGRRSLQDFLNQHIFYLSSKTLQFECVVLFRKSNGTLYKINFNY